MIRNGRNFVVRENPESKQVIVYSGNTQRFLSSEEFEELKFQIKDVRILAGKTLGSRSGYLYSNDREDMEEFYGLPDEVIIGQVIFGERDLEENSQEFEKASTRANVFAKRIPPIFDRDSESFKEYEDEEGKSYRRFPTVDAIINIFAGSKPFRSFVDKSELEDILMFADLGTKGFSEQTKKQVLDKVARHYHFKDTESREYVLEKASEAFDMLQKELPPVSRDGLVLVYGGEDTAEIVNRPFWYLHYSPQSVDKVLESYWQELGRKIETHEPVDKKDIDTAIRNLELFPENVPANVYGYFEYAQERGISPQILFAANSKANEIVETQNYSVLSRSTLNHCSDELRESLLSGLEEFVVHRMAPEILGSNSLGNAIKQLGLPNIEGLGETYENVVGRAIDDYLQNPFEYMDFGKFIGVVNRTLGGHFIGTKVAQSVERMKSEPDFYKRFVEYIDSSVQLESMRLPLSEVRTLVGVSSQKLKDVANQAIDGAHKMKLQGLNDAEFAKYVSNVSLSSGKVQTQDYVLRRVHGMVSEDLEKGVSFRQALRNVGITKAPAIVRNSFEAQYSFN